MTRITGTVREDQYKVLIIRCSVLLRISLFQATVVENIKTHIGYSITFFENRAVYEIMWKSRAGRAVDDNKAHSHCILDT